MSDLAFVLITLGSAALFFLLGYLIGREDERRARQHVMDQAISAADRTLAMLDRKAPALMARALVAGLKCPVCGAGRSNDEITKGWCANCGVYSDGSTDR